MKLIGAREFNQDVTKAKRLAGLEPVFITDRGRPTHVLMNIAMFGQITGQSETIVDLLAMPGLPEMELGPEIVHSSRAWDHHADLGDPGR